MAEHVDTKGKVGPVTKGASIGEGVAGAIAVVLVFIAFQLGLEIPEPVAAALAVIIGWIGTLIGGKLVSPDKTIEFQQEQGNLPLEADPDDYDPGLGGKPRNQV